MQSGARLHRSTYPCPLHHFPQRPTQATELGAGCIHFPWQWPLKATPQPSKLLFNGLFLRLPESQGLPGIAGSLGAVGWAWLHPPPPVHVASASIFQLYPCHTPMLLQFCSPQLAVSVHLWDKLQTPLHYSILRILTGNSVGASQPWPWAETPESRGWHLNTTFCKAGKSLTKVGCIKQIHLNPEVICMHSNTGLHTEGL